MTSPLENAVEDSSQTLIVSRVSYLIGVLRTEDITRTAASEAGVSSASRPSQSAAAAHPGAGIGDGWAAIGLRGTASGPRHPDLPVGPRGGRVGQPLLPLLSL